MGQEVCPAIQSRGGLPKGGKDRTVDLSDQIVECLKRYKAKRAEWALAGGWGQSVPYFFVTTNGTPVGADEIRKVFKRVLQAAGLPRHFTPHCLRHTYASLLLQEDGGRLLYVSRQLGHANVTITADTYAKWIRPVGRGVVNALAISSVV